MPAKAPVLRLFFRLLKGKSDNKGADSGLSLRAFKVRQMRKLQVSVSYL